MAYVTGRPGFEGHYPPFAEAVDPARVCAMGLRSVDGPEGAALAGTAITIHDMGQIDRHGVAALLDRVRAADGLLHVSLDVDFLDPTIAPAVGTTVPGGATCREAHLIMEMVHESGMASSLDVVELNPLLDQDRRTARLMVDLVASLAGSRTRNLLEQAA